MGVRGLSSFISNNSCLKPHELCNTYLVIDGNNIATIFYMNFSKSHSAFGGDYDEFYDIVADFFSGLKKCGVIPIVIFDGATEKKKLKTKLKRCLGYLNDLEKFASGFSTNKFPPIFMRQTFIDVMVDMNIICVQSDFEADMEIATIARALNCPVLSYDSDFFIADVLYVPFPSVELKPFQYPGSDKFFIKCSIFDMNYFLKKFPGLARCHLPILATLLGNDFNESGLFLKFFNRVLKLRGKELYNNKIQMVLNWLSKETFESANEVILSHVGNKNKTEAWFALKSNEQNYSNNFISGSVLEKLTQQLGDVKLEKKNFNSKILSEIIQLYSECKIDKLVIDIADVGVYLTYIQLEDVHYHSSHFPSLPLIKSLYTLLIPYMEKPIPLKLFLSVGSQYLAEEINKDYNSFLNNVNLHDMLKESKEERMKLLYRILGVDDEHLNLLSVDHWSIFLMTVIYWIKQLNNLITSDHVHALILMVIANQVVQKFVGYYWTYSKFMSSKGAEINEFENTKILETGNPATFNEMLECVTMGEKIYIHSVFLPYKQTMKEEVDKTYDISVIHLYSCFQSCLFHVMQLNALLNYPLPHVKVSDFYSGTLLFNLYISIKRERNFGENLFKKTPNLSRIYKFLSTNLSKFLNKVPHEVGKTQMEFICGVNADGSSRYINMTNQRTFNI